MKNLKSILITGASSGIGEASALLFAKKGYRIYLLGRHPERLQSVLTQLQKISPEVKHASFQVDLSSPEAITSFTQTFLSTSLENKPTQLNGLINNAGVFDYKRFEDQSTSDWEHIFKTNLLGSVLLTQKLLPALKQQPSSIVNVSSSLAHTPIANTAPYSAMKAALNNWTQTLAIELAPYHIRVNSLSPGIVDTPLHSFATEQDRNSAGQQHLLKRVGQPQEVAESLLHLVEAEWMTGSDLVLDGGISLS